MVLISLYCLIYNYSTNTKVKKSNDIIG